MSADEQRKLAAIMFTDIVGYSKLIINEQSFFAELKRRNVHIIRSEPRIPRIYRDYRRNLFNPNPRYLRNPRLFLAMSRLEIGSLTREF